MSTKNFEVLSESLTPNEVKNKEFPKGVLGYQPSAVVEYLELVSKKWETVQRREKDLVEEIRRLGEVIENLKAKEEEISHLRKAAEAEAAQIREAGRKEAESYFIEAKNRSETIRGKTEEWLTNIISKVEETERRRNSFLTAFKTALDQHYELLNSDLHQNVGLEEQLSGFLEKMSMVSHQAELSNEHSMVEGQKLLS